MFDFPRPHSLSSQYLYRLHLELTVALHSHGEDSATLMLARRQGDFSLPLYALITGIGDPSGSIQFRMAVSPYSVLPCTVGSRICHNSPLFGR